MSEKSKDVEYTPIPMQEDVEALEGHDMKRHCKRRCQHKRRKMLKKIGLGAAITIFALSNLSTPSWSWRGYGGQQFNGEDKPTFYYPEELAEQNIPEPDHYAMKVASMFSDFDQDRDFDHHHGRGRPHHWGRGRHHGHHHGPPVAEEQDGPRGFHHGPPGCSRRPGFPGRHGHHGPPGPDERVDDEDFEENDMPFHGRKHHHHHHHHHHHGEGHGRHHGKHHGKHPHDEPQPEPEVENDLANDIDEDFDVSFPPLDVPSFDPVPSSEWIRIYDHHFNYEDVDVPEVETEDFTGIEQGDDQLHSMPYDDDRDMPPFMNAVDDEDVGGEFFEEPTPPTSSDVPHPTDEPRPPHHRFPHHPPHHRRPPHHRGGHCKDANLTSEVTTLEFSPEEFKEAALFVDGAFSGSKVEITQASSDDAVADKVQVEVSILTSDEKLNDLVAISSFDHEGKYSVEVKGPGHPPRPSHSFFGKFMGGPQDEPDHPPPPPCLKAHVKITFPAGLKKYDGLDLHLRAAFVSSNLSGLTFGKFRAGVGRGRIHLEDIEAEDIQVAAFRGKITGSYKPSHYFGASTVRGISNVTVTPTSANATIKANTVGGYAHIQLPADGYEGKFAVSALSGHNTVHAPNPADIHVTKLRPYLKAGYYKEDSASVVVVSAAHGVAKLEFV